MHTGGCWLLACSVVFYKTHWAQLEPAFTLIFWILSSFSLSLNDQKVPDVPGPLNLAHLPSGSFSHACMYHLRCTKRVILLIFFILWKRVTSASCESSLKLNSMSTVNLLNTRSDLFQCNLYNYKKVRFRFWTFPWKLMSDDQKPKLRL